ncbi:MAG: hypothetical protein LC772_01490 [Chloroflexi bacterium]|nr:hypothetical protein [Chloroflexota bacterium]
MNAYHAMRPRGGRLAIQTRSEGGAVFVRVSDTGCGIPTQMQSRVFEPFYTTKSESDGTGLGLAVSYGIIKEHNGQIELESTEGVGTTIILRLPAQDIHPIEPALAAGRAAA